MPQNIPEETNLLSTKDQQASQLTKINKLGKPSSKIPQADGTSNNMKVIEAKEDGQAIIFARKKPSENFLKA